MKSDVDEQMELLFAIQTLNAPTRLNLTSTGAMAKKKQQNENVIKSHIRRNFASAAAGNEVISEPQQSAD
jgi:hypothetical protein